MAKVKLVILIIVLGAASLAGLSSLRAIAAGTNEGNAEADVTVLPPQSIIVTPADKIITTSTTTYQFTSNATYSGGQSVDVTDYSEWTSSNPSVATIDFHTGLATIKAPGNIIISARYNGVTGNTTLKVLQGTPPPPSGGLGGSGGASSQGNTTYLNGYIDDHGLIFMDTVAESADGQVTLYLPEGTAARNKYGQPLYSITIKEDTQALSQPASSEFVCLAYDIGPGGATFSPPVTLSFKYSDSDVPDGVTEENMVFAVWGDGEWVELEGCVIDSVNNIATVTIGHLSTYTVIVHTSPARFAVTDLKVTPAEIHSDKIVTIIANVTNTGDLTGSLEVILSINGSLGQVQTVTIRGQASQTLNFNVVSGPAGEYILDINGLSGRFTVMPEPEGTVAEIPALTPSPEPEPIAEPTNEPAPTAVPTEIILPTNEPTETVKETLPIQITDNRMRLITGSIGGFLVLGALIALLVQRRHI